MTPCDTVQRNFSRSAATYDAHSRIQERVGVTLLEQLPAPGTVRRILEIGCGTGRYTGRLRQRYPQATLVALDIAAPMVAQARRRPDCQGVQFEVGDVMSGGPWEPFDLITANACLHWLDNIPATLRRLAGDLTADGWFCISVFGPGTYRELAEVLRELEPADRTPASRAFASATALRDWLQPAFNRIQMQTRNEVMAYPSLLSLLRKIKYSGTQGSNSERRPFTRREIQHLDRLYRRRFGAIQATYETIIATARTGDKSCQDYS